MKYNPALHHRRSIRLGGYDYAHAGEYFLTVCTYGHECILAAIENEEVTVTEIGKIVKEEWLRTPAVRPNVQLDEFIVMPNHLHGIVIIKNDIFVGANGNSPQRGKRIDMDPPPRKTPFRSPSGTIGAIVRGFKSAATKRVNELQDTPGKPLWQRDYYEHIVRDERDLERIREYIRLNPTRWPVDEENPVKSRKTLNNAG